MAVAVCSAGWPALCGEEREEEEVVGAHDHRSDGEQEDDDGLGVRAPIKRGWVVWAFLADGE